jgi:hypothetical protein
MFQLGAFTRNVCTLPSCCDVSVLFVRHLQHSSSQQYTPDITAGLSRWRSRAGQITFATCRPLLRRCYQHRLKNTTARVVTSPAVRHSCLCCGLNDRKAGVLSNNASVYCLRTGASVSCRNVSCSPVWTGVMPLCGLCSTSAAASRTHTAFFTLGRNVRQHW